MQAYFIRHGRTEGNVQHRYVGKTDESLLPSEAVGLLERSPYLPSAASVDALYVSPLLRCRETAEILFPHKKQLVVKDFRECDFGGFEYKNYAELNGNPDYQRFIDTNGESGFPGGETLRQFQARCAGAFCKLVEQELNQVSQHRLVFVVHGGTIMAIFDRFSHPHRDYYDWQVKNGDGFAVEIVMDKETGEPRLCNVRGLMEDGHSLLEK